MAVRTEAAARAVLRVGADLIAFSGGSEADIVKLDGAGTTIALRRGRLGVRLVAKVDAGKRPVEITIPSGVLRLSAPGEYDIVAGDAKSPARLAVPAGEARFSGKGLDAVVATGGGRAAERRRPRHDAAGQHRRGCVFAEWWRGQKRDAADAPALRHVSAAITGHEMLDEHGAWETVAGLGDVWFPNDAPRGWVPFRYGHWRWISPWGWTWIDDMPWGFATSHYGRWANIGGSDTEAGRWGWVPEALREAPGEHGGEPAFMPAAVAFLGTAGVGLSYPDAFSPAVAWFPLAPGEVYWPSFTDDPEAIRRLNAGAVADPAAIGRGPERRSAGRHRHRPISQPALCQRRAAPGIRKRQAGCRRGDRAAGAAARKRAAARRLAGHRAGRDDPAGQGRGRIGPAWRGREPGQGPRRARPHCQMARAPETRDRNNGFASPCLDHADG